MTSDRELIKQFEKEIGRKLEERKFEEIGVYKKQGYAIGDNGEVVGLNLDEIELKPVPVSLSKFHHLKKLKWINTKLTDISFLQGLTNLTQLDLWHNKITDISVLKGLRNLAVLALGGNQITDFSVLKGLNQLTKLSLWNNQITDISFIQGLIKLKKLDLRYNQIKELPEALVELGLEIDVDEEQEWEQKIYLYNNPLEKPPLEIVKKGLQAIRTYFESLKKETTLPLNEVKVLLVGEGAAGKTSLVKRLLGKKFDKKESQTHGININTWEITVDKTNIKVRLWDFGGQEIMHATHQFFLSKRSLYILVLDGRKDEKTEYWLNHIKSFGGDSPVMIVINKIDENPGFDVNRLFLMEKYPNIKGFYRLSCASGSGIDEFKKKLTKELTAVELIRTTWANSWFQVKKQLEEMKDNFISYDTYQKICTDAGIKDEKEQDTLVDFLNDLGVILHFKEFHLQDTHVLEPKWITNAVYKIINSELLSSGKGVLELCRLGEILKAKKGEKTAYTYPPDKYKYIFQLMKKFELCFPIDEDKILVPDLLEVGEPPIDFPYTGALKFRISYNFLPKSVMPRFIVRSHKDIKNKLSWRTGVVLENKGFNATAVVKADQREKIINIYVEGVQKRDYFAHILHTFREINDSFEQIEVDECVPLPDKPKIAVNYLHLLRLERMGQVEFLPEKSERNYNVKELLEGIKPEKERKKEIELLLRENKMVINVLPAAPVAPKEPGTKKLLKTILKIAAAVAALIAFLAALFALIDSQSFREFWEKLIS